MRPKTPATVLLKPPPHSHAGRFMRLALNGLAGNKQVPAATRRGKNDTLEYLYDLAPSEARPVEGISWHR